MEDVLDEVVSSEDLQGLALVCSQSKYTVAQTTTQPHAQKFEKVFHEQLHAGHVVPKAQFEYAWCLVRSRYPTDIRKGILLLKELFNSHPEGKRDYLFYLAIGNARIKEYNKALHYVKSFLQIEPANQQVLALERQINKRMEKEGLIGMAVAGGAVLALGGLVGLGIALSRK